MATTKKAPAKKPVAKTPSKAEPTYTMQAPAKKPVAKTPSKAEPTYTMPMEVKNWIDQASSRMAHMTSEIARLKEENKQLRRTHKLMEQRVMGMSVE